MMISTVASALLLASSVSAHSWIWCTDYNPAVRGQRPQGPGETDPARRVFDNTKCEGYSPNFDSAFFDPSVDDNFGVDFGFENRPNFDGDEFCLTRPNTYSANLPQATYESGAIVTVVYPAKNHVAALTTNVFIPDFGVNVYMAPLGSAITSTNFPSSVDFRTNGLLPDFNLNHTNGQIDYLGFQNCPNFDNGNDRATCTMDFQLPENMQPGEYFFAWHWEFNSGEHYSTCWSAQVTNGGQTGATTNAGQTTATTTSRATTTTQRTTTAAQTTQTQTTQTQPTRPVNTGVVDGAECSVDGRAACSKGLTPPRGTCMVTDENDPENGFICQCAEGFENTNDPRTCNLESGVRVRIVLNVEYALITDFALFERALEIELADRINVELDRLSITFSEGTTGDETGLVVAMLSVAGAEDNEQLTARSFFDQLTDRSTSASGSHEFGAMSNALSISCLDCEDAASGPDTGSGRDGSGLDSASSALVPSLALVAVAALSSLLQ